MPANRSSSIKRKWPLCAPKRAAPRRPAEFNDILAPVRKRRAYATSPLSASRFIFAPSASIAGASGESGEKDKRKGIAREPDDRLARFSSQD